MFQFKEKQTIEFAFLWYTFEVLILSVFCGIINLHKEFDV